MQIFVIISIIISTKLCLITVSRKLQTQGQQAKTQQCVPVKFLASKYLVVIEIMAKQSWRLFWGHTV